MDANVLCGIGGLHFDDSPGATNDNNFGPSYSRTDNGCWGPHTVAHELAHNLGGVQYSAPNSSQAGHCVDEYDVMCYSDEPNFPPMQNICTDPAYENRLDCSHDDYYHPNPPAGSYLATHWNIANSQFLFPNSQPPPPPPPPPPSLCTTQSSTYTSTDVPKAIPDLVTVTSALTVTGQHILTDVIVSNLNISHTYDGDLNAYLISPAGTQVELFTNVGGNGNNFTDTSLYDSAPLSIANGVPPFRGTYRPEGSLSTLTSQNKSGTWQLRITDVSEQDIGQLTSWSLEFCTLGEVDTDAPAAAPTTTPAPNASGWNNSTPVTIDWNWSDAGSGIDPANCTTTSTVSTAGETTATATCTDNAGLVGTATQIVRIDTVAPTIVAAQTTAPDLANGAYSGPVRVRFTCTDATSGLAGSCPPDQVLSELGSNTSTAATISDTAGNQATSNTVTVTILQSQQLSFTSNPPNPAVVGTTYTPTAESTAGLAVTITVDPASANVCSIAAATVSFIGAGSCALNADQPGSANTQPATRVRQTIDVTQAPSFVLANPPLTATTGQPYSYAFAADGIPAPTFSLAAGAPAWLTITPAGTVSGTPPSGTTSLTYSVVATNVAGQATAGPFTVAVATAPPTNRADLTMTLSCPATVRRNSATTCTAVVHNRGPATATAINVGMALPSGSRRISATPQATVRSNLLAWRIASLSPSASATFTATFTPTHVGRFRIAAAAIGLPTDPVLTNNTVISTLTVAR